VRGLACASLLGILAAAAAGAEGDTELPEKARLSRGSLHYTMRRNWPLPAGVEAAAEPGIRKGRLEGLEFWFFDVDGNGEFDDVGVDGWSLTKMAYMLPYEEETLFGVSNVTWRMEPDGSMIRYRKEPIELAPGQRKILVAFNQWRLMNGLPAVRVSQALTDACARHCAYMELHGFDHTEEAGEEGYSPEGAEAGLRSCLSEESPDRSIALFYATFYHRLPLMDPSTRSIGVGNSTRYTALDALSDRQPRAWNYPIIVPAPNTFGHPTNFVAETPDPGIPAAIEAGFPITMTFREGTRIHDAQAELRMKGKGGKLGPAVPVLVSAPDAPANESRPDNRCSICVIPMQQLAPLATWQVTVSWKENDEARSETWLFNTGRAGPFPTLHYDGR